MVNSPELRVERMVDGKENLFIKNDPSSPEQIICAPSLPGSPPLTPSPKLRNHSPRHNVSISPNNLQSKLNNQSHHPVIMKHIPKDIVLQLADPSAANILLKQGMMSTH